jgi:hypothetical protein
MERGAAKGVGLGNLAKRLPMSRTTFTILAAGLAVAACNHASEQRTEDEDVSSPKIAAKRIERVADRLFSALPKKTVTD